MNNIYLLFTTDEWKTRTSFTLRGIFGNINDLKKAVKTLIKNEVIDAGETAEWKEKEWKKTDIENLVNLIDIYIHKGYIGQFEADGGYL